MVLMAGCEEVVKRLFSDKDYENVSVLETPEHDEILKAMMRDPNYHVKDDHDRGGWILAPPETLHYHRTCTVDYYDKNFVPGAVLKEAMKRYDTSELARYTKTPTRNSVEFNPDTLEIDRGSFAFNCDRRLDLSKLKQRIEQVGCGAYEGWDHEYCGEAKDKYFRPLFCYIHPKPRASKGCKVEGVLRVIRDFQLGRI